MRVFIAGVMQASIAGKGMVDQTYRADLSGLLRDRWPELDVLDPIQLHPTSVEYGDELAKSTLFALLELAAGSDLVVAYLPQASMGTALEMHRAYNEGVPVICISPLRENWVVRALATRVFPDLPAFAAYLSHLDQPEDLLR